MGTLFDYLNWRGDLTFAQSPINEVDSLIFSLLSYIDLEEVVPADYEGEGISLRAAANSFFAKHPDPNKISIGLILPREIVSVLRAVKNTKRFRTVRVKGYRNVVDPAREMQFCALTFLVPDTGAVIAYRGTDDTLIGWKEDFNMGFLPFVPSQKEATDYLNAIAPHLPENLYLTGHSKGGNLAVWAGVNCEPAVRARLRQVWCNDGPGFGKGMLYNPNYLEIRPIIRFFVPQNAIIGILMEHNENYQVIESRNAGLFQHDGISWNVSGASFVCLETVTDASKRIDRTLNEWLEKMTTEQREQFVEALFGAISATKSTTLTELAEQSMQNGLPKLSLPDPEVRRALHKLFTLLIEMGKQNIRSTINERTAKLKK